MERVPPITSENTARTMAASKYGELKDMARELNWLSLERWNLEEMKRNKVGSLEIERQALLMGNRRGKKLKEEEEK